MSFKLFVSSFWTFFRKRKQFVFCTEVSFRLAQVCKMVTLVPIQHNSFNILCQGACHRWHLPRVSHTYPSNDLREPSNLSHFHFRGYSRCKFIIILDHTALYRAAPFLLTRFQPKRQLLPEEILWFSVHLCFPNVSFTTLLSGYTVNLGALKIFLPSFSAPKLKESWTIWKWSGNWDPQGKWQEI